MTCKSYADWKDAYASCSKERRELTVKIELLSAELRAAKLEINSLRVSHELINRFGPEGTK